MELTKHSLPKQWQRFKGNLDMLLLYLNLRLCSRNKLGEMKVKTYLTREMLHAWSWKWEKTFNIEYCCNSHSFCTLLRSCGHGKLTK